MTAGVIKKTDEHGGVSFTLVSQSGGNISIASYKGVASYLSPSMGLTQTATPNGKRGKEWLDCNIDVEEYYRKIEFLAWLTDEEKLGIRHFLEEESLNEE